MCDNSHSPSFTSLDSCKAWLSRNLNCTSLSGPAATNSAAAGSQSRTTSLSCYSSSMSWALREPRVSYWQTERQRQVRQSAVRADHNPAGASFKQRRTFTSSREHLPLFFVGAGLPQIAALVGSAKSYAERLFTCPQGNCSTLSPPALRSCTRRRTKTLNFRTMRSKKSCA